MITVIRKNIKSKYFKYVIWFFIAILTVVFVMPNLGDLLKGPQWLIRVNDTQINGQEFYRAVSKQEYNVRVMREQYGAYADMFLNMLGLNRDPKTMAFEEVVQNAVVDELVQSIPLYISEDFIDQKFSDPLFVQQSGLYNILPLGFFTPQGIDEQALRIYLSRMGMNFSSFKLEIERAMGRYIALELAGMAQYAPSYVLNEAVDQEFALRKYGILHFALDDIVNEQKKKPISEHDLKQFFDQENKKSNRYRVPEKRAGVFWKFNPSTYGIVVPDNEIQEFYEKHKVRKYVDAPSKVQVRRILLKSSETEPQEILRQRALSLRAELEQDPDTFAQKAKELSDDAESASNGGLLPFFSKGDRNQVFERKSFVLRNNGDISEVFQTEDGFEIVQRVDKKPMQFKSLSQVKNEIHETLLNQAFDKKFSADAKKVIEPMGINEEALAAFVKEKKSKEHTVPLSVVDDSKKMQMLFRLKDGQAGFFVEGNNGYIILLKETKKRYLPQLDSIKAVVRDDYIQDQAQKILIDRIEQAKDDLQYNDLESVAKKYGASLQKTELIKRDDNDKLKALNDKGVPTNKMLQLEKKGTMATQVSNETGYLFYVLEVSKDDTGLTPEKEVSVANQLRNDRKGLFVQGFVASLSRNATIETNNSLFTLNEPQAI